MPQALAAVYIHLVFSTKERRALLRDATVRAELHAYLSGVSKQLDCPAVQVGGAADHVHVLSRVGRTITLADWVKELKRVSIVWVKEQGQDYANFQWQSGYACFSVSQSNLAKVAEYVADQEKHHERMSFEEELRLLLKRHHVEFDERYVWD